MGGGKWIFDSKQGRKLISGPFQLQTPPTCSQATVRPPDGVHLLESPTGQKWAITKMKLLQNAQVEVSKVFNIEFTTWGFIEKPGSNMKGWVRMNDLCSMDASSASCDLRNCAAMSSAPSFDNQAFGAEKSSSEIFIGPLLLESFARQAA